MFMHVPARVRAAMRVSTKVGLAAGVAWLAHVPMASAQNAAESQLEKDLVEQAKKEGKLYLNWSDYGDVMNQWIAGYLKAYGLEGAVEVVHTPNPNGTAAFLQLEEEFAAKRPAHADIMEGAELRTALGISGFKQKTGFLATIDYAALPNIEPSMVKGDNKAVVYAQVMPGITYNTTKINKADLPENVEEFASRECPASALMGPNRLN